MKSTANPSQVTAARTSAIRDRVSSPVSCSPTERMPVARTAAAAAGGLSAHQVRSRTHGLRGGEVAGMAPMLGISERVARGAR